MFSKRIKKLYSQYIKLSLGKRLIIFSAFIWLLQAIPKWAFVILGDGEAAASIMKLLVTPRSEQ